MAVNPTENLPKNPKEDIIFLGENDDRFFSPISKKWYFVEPRINELTTIRTQILERRLIEFGFSADFGYVLTSIRESMQLIGSNKPYDGYVKLSNLLSGLNDLGVKNDLCMWVCAVFIYEEGENPWEYSEEVSLRKIQAWACFNKGFFLGLAVDSLADYRKDLLKIFQGFTETSEDEDLKTRRKEAIKKVFDLKPD